MHTVFGGSHGGPSVLTEPDHHGDMARSPSAGWSSAAGSPSRRLGPSPVLCYSPELHGVRHQRLPRWLFVAVGLARPVGEPVVLGFTASTLSTGDLMRVGFFAILLGGVGR